jgi:8-oxo-dGTP pyrophosphatase MutT (NUDIX family)
MGRRPIETPRVTQLSLSFDKETDIFSSVRSVEFAYWDYIDNYNKLTPSRYPYYKLVHFLEQIMLQKYPSIAHKSADIMKMYTKYKKRLATDGVIMYTVNSGGGIQLLTVRITGSKIWSMPKGKRESGEESHECAIREFGEETGLNIYDLAVREQESVSILKTRFYIFEAFSIIPTHKYKTNEISGVKWVYLNDIFRNKEAYSRQVFLVATYLGGPALPLNPLAK